MSDMVDKQGYRRTGGMVSMADFGKEGLVSAIAGREIAPGIGDSALAEMIDALPDDLPVFVRNVLRYEDRIQAALATWWGGHRAKWHEFSEAEKQEVGAAADEAMANLGVRRVLARSEELRPCPVCSSRRFPNIGFGKVFWDCPACEFARQDAVLADWLGKVDAAWNAIGLKMIGKVNWPVTHPMISAVEAVLSGQHSAAYLHGEPGTGKTQQSAEYIRAILECQRGRFDFGHADSFSPDEVPFPSALHISEVDLINSLRGGGGNPPERRIEYYINLRHLAVDDIGTVKSTEFAYTTMYQIVNARFIAKKPTVFTSNYSLPALRGKGLYDERITQRIFEMCGGRQAYADGSLGIVEMTECYRMPSGEVVLW